MLAPAPPRCWTRSSTRNDSDTFSIWPSTNCSVNFPGKVIRWSVAMEPATATGTGTLPRDGVRRDARWTSEDDPNTLGAARVARRAAILQGPADSVQGPPRAGEQWTATTPRVPCRAFEARGEGWSFLQSASARRSDVPSWATPTTPSRQPTAVPEVTTAASQPEPATTPAPPRVKPVMITRVGRSQTDSSPVSATPACPAR